MFKPATVSPAALSQQLKEGHDLALIHTLPQAHYESVHLPGAQHACVYEVTFPDQVKDVAPDKARPVVLYGFSGASRDAATAAEKLDRLGYEKIAVLEGGLTAWAGAGFPLEGSDPRSGLQPVPPVSFPDGRYGVDAENSEIRWVGRNPTTTHHGTLKLAGGWIAVADGQWSGSFEIDMQSIRNINLEGDPLQAVLVAHLLSDDFFFVERFPKAVFTLESAAPMAEGALTTPNLEIRGTLLLRGIKKEIRFPATLSRPADGGLIAEAHFDIDRTRWGVIYGSSRFFQHLGMHLVFELISIQLRIVAGAHGA